MAGPVIQARNLVKKVGNFTAVDGVTLDIAPGEIYGFLGPNGAGKTTTISMLLGILQPTAGEVRLFGETLQSNPFEIKRRIGVVAEYLSFYNEMTAWEYLQFFGELYRVENADTRAEYLLDRLTLWDFKDALVGAYSTGMKRKLGLARALMHSPDVLMMDEPVSGLDPYGIIQVREVLEETLAEGKTILICSHILSEVERTVNRVGIIAKGRLLVEDTMDNIRERVGGERHVEVEIVEVKDGLIPALEGLPFVTRVHNDGGRLSVYTSDEQDYRAELGRVIAESGGIIQGMRTVQASLEEAFVIITESHISRFAGEQHGH